MNAAEYTTIIVAILGGIGVVIGVIANLWTWLVKNKQEAMEDRFELRISKAKEEMAESMNNRFVTNERFESLQKLIDLRFSHVSGKLEEILTVLNEAKQYGKVSQ